MTVGWKCDLYHTRVMDACQRAEGKAHLFLDISFITFPKDVFDGVLGKTGPRSF